VTEWSEFCLRYAEGRDGLWLAMDGDVVHGSVAIDGSRAQESGAQWGKEVNEQLFTLGDA